MKGFFDFDGPLARAGNLIFDAGALSLAWAVASLPVFTIGAATTALFYVFTRRVSNVEGYALRDFFTSFKREFVKATVVWVVAAAALFVIIFNIVSIDWIAGTFRLSAAARFIFLTVQYAAALETVIFLIFAFPYLSRFDVGIRDLVKSAFFLANRHFITSFLCVLTAVALGLLTLSFFPLILFDVGIYALCSSYLIMRVFKKYRPELN